MESTGRDPAKQALVEATLQSFKGSKAYPYIESKIRSGIYRTNRATRNRNREFLQKTKVRLTQKLARNKSSQVKGDIDKVRKINTLLPIIDDETNVENANNSGSDGNNANNNEWASEEEHILDSVSQQAPILAPMAHQEEADNNNDDEELPAGENVRPNKPFIKMERDCNELFDPCTREPIEPNTMKELEKRIRNLRISLSDNPETEQFPVEITTRLDLLIDLLNRKEPPNNKLFRYTINGQLYEAYWDIVFALNLLDDFQRTKDFFMINKKAELIQASEAEIYNNNPIEYLRGRNVNEGASGASDITFCYKNPKEILAEDPCSAVTGEGCSIGAAPVDSRTKFYFCSSKFYKKDSSKSAESFDIQKIYTAVKSLHNNYDVRIILLVKDKEAVDTKLQNARNKYISEEASSVYGEKDLFVALLKLYDLAHQKIQGNITEESLKSVLGITDSIKPILSPRLHQHMAILKIQKAIQNFKKSGGNNKFLVGILPRGGKTYIAGGLVSILQPKRVVVLLGAKSETISQFTNDLFKYYQDFSDYEIVDVLEGASEAAIDPSKKYIFVMSVELYKMESSKRRILIELKSGTNRADLFICDEAHLKQTTEKAIKELEEGTAPLKSAREEDIDEESGLFELDKQMSKEVPVVYMTGTYIKPLKVFEIPEENVAIWDYQDIQEGKNIIDNEQYFKETFPGIYEEALAKCFTYGETYESIQNMYRRFPNLYLLSTQFTDDAKASFLTQSQGGEKVGFPTITHLFQVKKEYSPDKTDPALWHTGFKNPGGIARLINYLSPRNEIQNIDGAAIPEIGSVMRRIDRISQRIGDRLAFFTKDFVVHSQLWFLPTMQGHPLIKRMSALGGVIFQSQWYRKHFNILAVSSSADWSKISQAKDRRIQINGGTFTWACPSGKESLKMCILKEEATARAQGKGLIILAQNMLHLGISLSCVDIVVLLDAGEKVDERIQKMYRALTESTNKKGGFIVDMNYFRTVTAIMNYQIQATKARKKGEVYANSGLKEAFNSIIETYSIDDDLDIYSSKVEGGPSRIENETMPELQRMMQKAPTGRGDGMVISEAGIALNRNIEDVLKGEYDRGLDHILGELADDSDKVLREHGSDVGVAEEENDDSIERAPRAPKLFPNAVEQNPVEKKKAFMDIFKTTLKLGVFGTSYKTIPELIEGFRNHKSLRDIVYDTLVKRGAIQEGANSEDLNRLILKELTIISEKKQDSYKGMKESFNSRDSRNQTFQEILEYIVNNLTPKDKERHKFGEVFTPLTLVDEMLSKLPVEVWTNKDLKWLDPANGIGNFPIKAFIGQTEGEHTYPGLFEGLKKAIPEEGKRCKWIIEEMLYMVDINSKNNLIARRLFEKICPGAKANIEKIDPKNGFMTNKSLLFNDKEIKDFDIVMGNPPYNPPKTETGSSGNSIWQNFVIKSHSILNNKGYLLLLHPPGWKKPSDEVFKPEKFSSGDYTGQIRQGQVWQVLKDSGVFKFIYTNDQRSKVVDYLPHFPAVDYYVYQKGGDKSGCDTKNVFLGTIELSKGVRLNYNLKYLPNLITKQTQDILHKITSKEGDKPNFTRGIDERGITWTGKSIDWFYDSNKSGFQYKKHGMTALTKSGESKDTVNINKVVINFGGGIDAYNVKYVASSDEIGVLDMTMYSRVESDKDGKRIEAFFKSDIVKFIFLITQYASGKMTKNEPLVANSLSIPPEGEDYYKFFAIEEHKKYIGEILAHYEKFKAPKRFAKTLKAKGGSRQAPRRFTRKLKRV